MKRTFVQWNHLTVAEIKKIITHFTDAESTYRTRSHTATSHIASMWSSEADRVQAIRMFWETTLPLVEAGERIDGHVRRFLLHT